MATAAKNRTTKQNPSRRRASVKKPDKAPASPLDTRQALIEAAGNVFAEKGFERSTAKEICARARANTAAVNYHFGGIEPLYAATLEEARKRIFSARAIARAVEGKSDPRDQLEAVVGVIVRNLLGAATSPWAARLFGRDMISPSPTSATTKEKFALPRARLMRRLVSRLMDLPEDDPAVAHACISLMAPVCTLILADRRMIQRALPALDLAPEHSDALVRHLVRFALAGLTAAAQAARHSR